MQYKNIFRIFGLLLMLFSFTMLPSLLISWWYGDGATQAFSDGFFAPLILGALLWLPYRNDKKELRVRDGFFVVMLFWTVLSVVGAIPLAHSDGANMSITDAIFESMSGLTTTGATVITGIDNLPHAVLFYRQLLQWLGGMGIIVLAVAILPMLGVGGMQLYRAETPGPMKDSKLTPRITETAKALWYIYLGLTVLCALAYWAAGMTLFDAISHSFSTIAIGGFSTHDLSIGFFDSAIIEMVAIFFMLLAGMNFALHFLAWNAKSLRVYIEDSEVKAYLLLLAIIGLITVAYLHQHNIFTTMEQTWVKGLFHVVSIGTTTGYSSVDYASWPSFLPVLLLLSSFIGGCAGSTGGGIKVIRFLLLIKQSMREIKQLVHPSAQIVVKIGRKVISDQVIRSVWGFFAAYVAAFVIMMLLLMAIGIDQITAFSAVAACMNNLGPGLGAVANHYGDLADPAKWVLSFAMLLGRLEIFTILVLLSPTFWRR